MCSMFRLGFVLGADMDAVTAIITAIITAIAGLLGAGIGYWLNVPTAGSAGPVDKWL